MMMTRVRNALKILNRLNDREMFILGCALENLVILLKSRDERGNIRTDERPDNGWRTLENDTHVQFDLESGEIIGGPEALVGAKFEKNEKGKTIAKKPDGSTVGWEGLKKPSKISKKAKIKAGWVYRDTIKELDKLKVGAEITDSEGTTFKKVFGDLWQSETGSLVSSGRIARMYEDEEIDVADGNESDDRDVIEISDLSKNGYSKFTSIGEMCDKGDILQVKTSDGLFVNFVATSLDYNGRVMWQREGKESEWDLSTYDLFDYCRSVGDSSANMRIIRAEKAETKPLEKNVKIGKVGNDDEAREKAYELMASAPAGAAVAYSSGGTNLWQKQEDGTWKNLEDGRYLTTMGVSYESKWASATLITPKNAEKKAKVLEEKLEAEAEGTRKLQKVFNENEESVRQTKMLSGNLKADRVDYNEIKPLSKPLTDEEIIQKIGGGDTTKGSCSSVALCYCANLAGYDCLDYRGGASCSAFALNTDIEEIARLPDVGGILENSGSDITNSLAVMQEMEGGKIYYFATGLHAACVRKNAGKYEYLELQSGAGRNGWHELTEERLRNRFKAGRRGGSTVLVDAEKLGKSKSFRFYCGFFNTAEDQQQKSKYGFEK